MGRHQQRVCAAVPLDQARCLSGVPVRQQHRGGAREHGRQVAEHEPADEAELRDHQQAVVAGRAASAPIPVRWRSGPCSSSGSHPWRSRSCPRRAGSTACRRDRPVGAVRLRPTPAAAPTSPGATTSTSGTASASRRHLSRRGLAAESDQRSRRALLEQRAQLLFAEHRRDQREHGAAVDAGHQRDHRLDRVPSAKPDDVARDDALILQSGREAGGRAPQFRERDRGLATDQRRLVGEGGRARVKVMPQVLGTPVALGVVLRGLRLVLARCHFASSSDQVPAVCELSPVFAWLH